MFPRALTLIAIALGFTILVNRAVAQTSVTDGVIISADSMVRDLEKKTVRLKGNVQLVFKGNHMSCDKALLNLSKQTVNAEGHIILYNEKVHMEGDKLIFNYNSNTGFLYNGFVQSGQVVFEGDVVEKTGENRYIASNAEYTACETCPPGWSFSGRTIDAELGGYAHIERPIFRVGGVPLLILPSLIVPLKSARQSGVLVPSLEFSHKGGPALSGIYFWAIDRSQDMTLTGRWYEKRGYKALDEYRYVLDKESKGRLAGAFMEDRVLKNDYPGTNMGTVDRWYLTYDHYQQLPENYVDRASIHQISDLRYVRDFPDEIAGIGDPALENKASITKLSDNQYASAEVDVYQNLLKNFPMQSNDDAVHRVPELKYSYKEQRLFENGPLVNVDVDYVNFARDKWGYDAMMPCSSVAGWGALTPVQQQALCTPNQVVPLGSILTNNNGVYRIQMGDPRGAVVRDSHFTPYQNSTDPQHSAYQDIQRTGQRLDVLPSMSYPFQVGKIIDFLPSVTYRETQYRFNMSDMDDQPNFDETAARRYVQTDLKAKTQFYKIYGDLDDPKATRWKHSIEPEIYYSYIPWVRMPNHPFFGQFDGLSYSRQFDPLSDSDLGNKNTGVQFDYNDRTFQRRVVSYSVDNRITRKLFNDGMTDYKTLTLFRIGQSYDFDEAARGPGSRPWSTIDSLLDMRFEHFETYTTASYIPYAHKTNVNARIRGMLTPKNFLQFGYVDNFILNPDYSVVDGGETRNYSVASGVVSKFFDVALEVDYSDITHRLYSWSYSLNLRPPGRCWLIHIEQTQIIGGEPTYRGSVSFDFGGETKAEAATASQVM